MSWIKWGEKLAPEPWVAAFREQLQAHEIPAPMNIEDWRRLHTAEHWFKLGFDTGRLDGRWEAFMKGREGRPELIALVEKAIAYLATPWEDAGESVSYINHRDGRAADYLRRHLEELR